MRVLEKKRRCGHPIERRATWWTGFRPGNVRLSDFEGQLTNEAIGWIGRGAHRREGRSSGRPSSKRLVKASFQRTDGRETVGIPPIDSASAAAADCDGRVDPEDQGQPRAFLVLDQSLLRRPSGRFNWPRFVA